MTPATAQEFSFGRHIVRVAKVREGCWTFTIDDGEASEPFPTSTAAWAAGIRAAFVLNARARLDRLA